MKRRVAITGLGLVCSQGQVLDEVFKAWCDGQSGTAVHSVGEAPFTLTAALALCSHFDPSPFITRNRLTAMDRVSQLSVVAAQSAWNHAGLNELSPTETEQAGVFWGTGIGGAQSTDRSYRDVFIKQRSRISPLSVVLAMNNAAASHVALQLGLGGECLTYSVACASSAIAVGEAFRRIQSGHLQRAVAGGGEACLPFGPLKAWESLRVMSDTQCRPFHAQRDGLVLGEGSAALVLEDWDLAQHRGATIYAEVVGYGSTCDHAHLTLPNAQGQARALNQALSEASLNPTDIHYVNAHGTATIDGDPVEIKALIGTLGSHAAHTMVSSTKSMHGHLLGAAGAVEILATTLALHHQVVPPTAHLDTLDPACEGVDHVRHSARDGVRLQAALCNSFAFGGSNAVVALRCSNIA
jgi:3-oxoacyl-[acyl-carrier-protein] synthase II